MHLGGSFLGAADFSSLPQQLVTGFLDGSIYALLALGYSMVYGVLRLINFAHGEVYMLGAYSSLFTSWALGYGKNPKETSNPMNLLIMLLVSMTVCGTVGVIVERLAYRPMRNQPRIASLITAIGLSLLFQYGGQLVLPVSPQPNISEKVNYYRGTNEWTLRPMDSTLVATMNATKAEADTAQAALDKAIGEKQPDAVTDPLRDAADKARAKGRDAETAALQSEVKIITQKGKLIMLAATAVLMLLLTYLVMFTSVGRKMRAVSHDFDSASLMGIDVNKIVSITFLIGSSLAGAAAMMNATFFGTVLNTQVGFTPGLKAFVAAVLGGIGNIPGAVVGALLMGLAEAMVVWAGFSQYKDAIAFVILIGVLLFRPGGILGSSKVEKV